MPATALRKAWAKAERFLQYQTQPLSYLRHVLGIEPWTGRNGKRGQLELVQDIGDSVRRQLAGNVYAPKIFRVDSAHGVGKTYQATAAQQRTALTRTYGKGKEPADLLAGIARTETSAISVANSTFATRLSSLYSASTERINSATAAVQAKDKQVAAQRLATVHQVTQQLAGLR